MKIADSLLFLEQYNHLNKSEIISALILHDIIKKGINEDQCTVFEHPKLASDYFRNQYDENIINFPDLQLSIDNICRLIESHMGQWNTSKHSELELSKPTGEDEKFVHLCDYLASRKFLECVL